MAWSEFAPNYFWRLTVLFNISFVANPIGNPPKEIILDQDVNFE